MGRRWGLLLVVVALLGAVGALYYISPWLLKRPNGATPARPAAARGEAKVAAPPAEIVALRDEAQVAVPGAAKGAAGGQAPARHWAEALQRPGLPNLHKVSEQLYRGAQPTDEGWAQLKALGLKTVVNLRALHGESWEARPAGLAYAHIYFNPLAAPEDEEIVQFLKIATDPRRAPVFVHCAHGADRTGTMCAAYRVVVEGWTPEEAVAEMKEGGFGFHGAVYESYAEYISNMDVKALRRQVGVR